MIGVALYFSLYLLAGAISTGAIFWLIGHGRDELSELYPNSGAKPWGIWDTVKMCFLFSLGTILAFVPVLFLAGYAIVCIIIYAIDFCYALKTMEQKAEERTT